MTRAEFANRLHEAGHKVTPQREAIWNCLAPGKHLTVEDIHNQVFDDLKYTDSSTVYRTVELLEELGLAKEVVLESGTYYEVSGTPHGHFVCRSCNSITDIGITMDFSAKELSGSAQGVSASDVVIYGECESPCDSKGAQFTGGSARIGLRLTIES